jgi:hypothetical protein
MEMHGGDRSKVTSRNLDAIGITKSQSSRWQRPKSNAQIVTSVTVQKGADAGGIKAGAIDIGLWA